MPPLNAIRILGEASYVCARAARVGKVQAQVHDQRQEIARGGNVAAALQIAEVSAIVDSGYEEALRAAEAAKADAKLALDALQQYSGLPGSSPWQTQVDLLLS